MGLISNYNVNLRYKTSEFLHIRVNNDTMGAKAPTCLYNAALNFSAHFPQPTIINKYAYIR